MEEGKKRKKKRRRLLGHGDRAGWSGFRYPARAALQPKNFRSQLLPDGVLTGYRTSTGTVASQDGAGAKTIAGGCSLLATVLSSFLLNKSETTHQHQEAIHSRSNLVAEGREKIGGGKERRKEKKKKSAPTNGQTYILQLSKHNTATPPTFILRLIHHSSRGSPPPLPRNQIPVSYKFVISTT